VNRGYKENAKGERDFIPYPKEQLDLVMELSRRIIEQYNIRPEFVLGHSDIAPTRKPDPGPLFPWKRFADEGLIVWPKESEVAVAIKQYENNIPDVPWFQRKLAEHGFEVPRDGFPNSMEPDEATRRSIRAFQAKYRQNDIRGNLDAETAAMLDVITRKPDATPRPAAPDSVADFKVQ
jgi:N-acetylmuramoyl-L-alanine amidase